MIENIIFDLGNVLIEFDYETYVKENIPKEYREILKKEIIESDDWLELDRGTLSYNDAAKIFSSRVPEMKDEIDKMFNEKFSGMLKPIEKNIALLPELKSKYNLYILSNFHKPSIEEMKRRHEFFELFDGEVVSCYCHHIKPEPEIYDLIIKKYNLAPEKTLFIDDRKENIEGSEKKGIVGLYLPDYEKLKSELEKYL